MLDNHFRRILPFWVRPVLGVYRRFNLHPHAVTLLGLAFAITAAWATAHSAFIAALVLWWIGRLFDGTDGILARESNRATPFGAYLDISCDLASYSGMVLGFYVVHPQLGFQWLLVLLGYILCTTTALALGSLEEKAQHASSDNRGLRLGAGLAEGGETGIMYTLFLVLPQLIEPLVYIWLFILGLTVLFRTALARRLPA